MGRPGLTPLPPAPRAGRVFEHAARVAVGDAAPDGRARLDAIARWLQDAAFADIVDAGLQDQGAWVVRRCRIRVPRFPAFHEPLTVSTHCSGLGRLWAERGTRVEGADGGLIEAVALWVHLDPNGGRPLPPSEHVVSVYGPSAGGREVKARLRHPRPPERASGVPWTFRAADLDVAGHVNNAVYWAVVEEELRDRRVDAFDGEVEHRTPAGAGPVEVVRDGSMLWVRDRDEVHASFAVEAG